MAKGSHGGWFGLDPSKRVCAGCGDKVTLAPKRGTAQAELWRWHLVFPDMPERSCWHHRCFQERLAA